MSNHEDTFIFKPEDPKKREPEKEKIARTEVDEFTIARRTVEYEDEEKSYTLPIIASILGVLLVIAIAVLVVFLTGNNDDSEPSPNPPDKIVTPAEDTEDEGEDEKEPVLNSYTLVYNGGDIFELESGGFSVVFDVYNDDGEKTGTKKLYIKDSTEITELRESGNIGNISVKAFIKRIQNQGEDMLVLDCKVNEDEKLILSVEYNGEEEEEPVEEETPEEETSPGESGFTDEPSTEDEETTNIDAPQE